VLYHLSRLYDAIPRAGLVFTHFDPEDENGADSFFQVHTDVFEAPTPWVTDLDNVSQTGAFSFAYIVADKITGLQSYSFCHSETFPRQARLLSLFFLSGWRPAPERDRAATAIMLRRFGIFVLLRFAIIGAPFD
jgi:hypothetical protein